MLFDVEVSFSISLRRTDTEWMYDHDQGEGQTAMFPECGIDSVIVVIGDNAEVRAILKTMRRHGCGESEKDRRMRSHLCINPARPTFVAVQEFADKW